MSVHPKFKKPFDKVLIANRGEIAVRVIRACHEMGIRTVAVYSDADREALHVRFAHQAFNIGPPPSTESYLRIDKIMEVAKQSGAQAIHPGYGFLSENGDLARACIEEGIKFVGPSAEAMYAMGDKVRARDAMVEAGVPVVPGTPPLDPEASDLVERAREIGFPVLLKASAGGGGKGMRIVREEKELVSALAQAAGEARASFGDDTVFMEKFVVRPRHIEVQVLADGHGNCLYLGERECSIQRRHQKLIEECPSPVVTPEERAKIGDLAVKAAKAVDYEGAGTVEFLRGDDGSYYFMEMNTRLQVEHPVTEEVTGMDLVKWQLRVAAGVPLDRAQDDVELHGHAIECRIIAEDATRNFMPCPGTIRGLRTPSGPGVRDDGGVYSGYTVPLHYDPMISKLVTWGSDREQAIERMARALDEYRIDGLTTSISFHKKVMRHQAFIDGDLHTGFLEEHPELVKAGDNEWLQQIAVVAAAVDHFRRQEQLATRPRGDRRRGAGSAWKRYGGKGWRR